VCFDQKEIDVQVFLNSFAPSIFFRGLRATHSLTHVFVYDILNFFID